MNSTNNPFLWDKQCPSFLGPINPIQRENQTISKKTNSFFDILSELRTLNFTRCDICFQTVSQPYTCSNCAKISCNVCTQKWLVGQNIQCPNCLHPLKETPCLAQEMSEICKEHKTKVSYYCMTCKMPACGDCAMFEDKHKNHKFEKLEKAYEEQMSEITKEINSLSNRLDNLNSLLVTLDSNIVAVTKNKEAKVTELSIVTEQMTQRLGTDLKSKLAVFIAQKGAINGEIECLQRIQHSLNQQLNCWSKSFLLVKSDETLRHLRELNAKPSQIDNENQVSLDFVSEIAPEFDTGIFSLQPFSVLRQTTEVVYSELLYCYGLKWRLKVYPNGNGTAKGIYLSVFLEMVEGLQSPSRYEYQVEMLNQRNPDSAPVMRDFVSEFVAGECWGYNKFFKIDMLEEEGYLVPEKDTILLKFSVRAQTFHQQCRDQKRYIEYLEEDRRKNNTLVAELREKLALETKEKERLLELLPKPVEISEDLLNVGEIKPAIPNKESVKEALLINIGSLETIENETPFNELILKIRGQKELSNKTESQKHDRDTFYNLLENNIENTNQELKASKNEEENIKDKNRISTGDSQEDSGPKEKVDLCAQFEVLDPEECSFQDMSSYSSEEECYEEEDINHEVNDTDHVVTAKDSEENENDRDNNDARDFDELRHSNKSQHSNTKTLESQDEEKSFSNREKRNYDDFEYEKPEMKDDEEGEKNLDRRSRVDGFFSQFEKGRYCEDVKSLKRGSNGELDSSPSWKRKPIFEEKRDSGKRTISKFMNDDLFN